MDRPETRYAPSGDLMIAYQITGEEHPVDLVMAPGTVSHLDMDWEYPEWARFLERISSFCRLIRFDKRGTGLSDRGVYAATLEERTDDIRAVMDAAGSERAVIFGDSEGGCMACVFAATYPERSRGLLLWGTMPRWVKTEGGLLVERDERGRPQHRADAQPGSRTPECDPRRDRTVDAHRLDRLTSQRGQ